MFFVKFCAPLAGSLRLFFLTQKLNFVDQSQVSLWQAASGGIIWLKNVTFFRPKKVPEPACPTR